MPSKDTVDSTSVNKALTALDEYVAFGRSGLRISPVTLGTMTFGKGGGTGEGMEESCKVFNHYYENGGNFFDTANIYSDGDSERFLGDLISDKRSDLVLASKYSGGKDFGKMLNGNPVDPNKRFNVNSGGNGRISLVQAVADSLGRLRTGHLDVLYVHMYDWSTPIEETVRALDDVVRSGKASYIAISDTPSWAIAKANTIAELRGWTQFIGLQTKYSLLDRSYEYDLLPAVAHLNMATVPWGVLDAGFLTGKYKPEDFENPNSASFRQQMVNWSLGLNKSWDVLDEVKKIAKEIGRTPAQVATNWIMQKPGVTSILVGARNVTQLKQNLEAMEFTLTAEQMERLDAVSAPMRSQIPFSARHYMDGNWKTYFHVGKTKPAPEFRSLLGY
ncbi:hypothetical protein H4R99_000059 [Coemansia sp. RSA 1722]|nr:hypothetical protein LPJ57_003705 [Coemansia sp. RSA 486]KAJ2238439.1 hypothetical protein IWW45_000059 [Coemansia sp. RSA 485]KAJ2606886.1 hypothetical protein H4R99_000059 [Coemansia sp. RSA 1722]